MLPARDDKGAIRILEMGHLPFSQALKDFHRERLEERARHEGRPVSLQMVIDDVYAIEKGVPCGTSRNREYNDWIDTLMSSPIQITQNTTK